MTTPIVSTPECVFCGIVAGTVPCAKVAEDATTFAFMDIDPGSDGHLLVIPKRHSVDLTDIPAEDLAATTLAAQRIARAPGSSIEELVDLIKRTYPSIYGNG